MIDFADFWALYPRRVARRAALKSWEREMRKGVSGDEIMTGLRRLLPSLTARDLQFIPHPATWLNQGRWEDETPLISLPRKRTYADVAMDRVNNGPKSVFGTDSDAQFVPPGQWESRSDDGDIRGGFELRLVASNR